MPIIINSNKASTDGKPRVYEKCSAGVHHIELVNLKVIPPSDQKGERLQFLFSTDENGADGKPKVICSRFPASLGEKSKLYAFLTTVLGLKRVDFDLELLVGLQADAVIVHNGQWVNIQALIPGTAKPLSKEARAERAAKAAAKTQAPVERAKSCENWDF